MEEDRLYELFADFDPDMSSDNLFMSRLEENLEAVELVKRRISDVHRRSRIAMIVAAVTGFVFGIAVASIYPFITAYISTLTSTAGITADIYDIYSPPLILTAICSCGFAITYAAYDITLAALNPKILNNKYV